MGENSSPINFMAHSVKTPKACLWVATCKLQLPWGCPWAFARDLAAWSHPADVKVGCRQVWICRPKAANPCYWFLNKSVNFCTMCTCGAAEIVTQRGDGRSYVIPNDFRGKNEIQPSQSSSDHCTMVFLVLVFFVKIKLLTLFWSYITAVSLM